MHYSVVIHDVNANDAIDMKNTLLSDGLVMDQDFKWCYQQAKWDNFSHEPVEPRLVQFDFSSPALATFYQLKWS